MAVETMRISIDVNVEDHTGPGFESASKKVSAFDKVIEKTQQRLKKVTGSRWDLTLDAVDKATQVIDAVESRMKNATGKAWNIIVGIKDTFTAPFRGILNLLKNPLVQAGAFLGVSFGIKDIVDTGKSFEAAMSQVAATMGKTVDEIGNLQDTAKEMGSTTAFTATQAAEGLNILAMAGLKAEEQIAAIPDVLNLASAGAMSLESAASYAVGTVKGFSDSMDNAQYYVDLIAKGATMANTSVSGLGEAFSTSAADAASYSQSADSVMVSLLRLAEQNITGAEAATALSRAMADIYTPSDAAQKALKSLGVAVYTGEGKARDFNDIVNELNASLSKMSDEQASATASTIFSTYGLRAFNKMAITTTDKLAEFEDGLGGAFGSAAAQAATQLDNLAGDMTLLQSAADGVKLTISNRLSPYLRDFTRWLTSKMPDIETAAGKALDFLDSKIADLRGTIAEFTSSDEWASSDIWGKIAIAWDKIVAEPFSAWWGSTGRPWLLDKVSGFGETLGSGITAGLLALLGFDASGAVEDGKSIGAGFIEGFKSGFDMDRIGEAITEWASDHKGIVAAAGVVAGGKLIGGFAKAFQAGKSIIGDITSIFGGGGSSGGADGLGNVLKNFTASTMTVTAGTVIVNSSTTSNAVRNVVQQATGGGLSLPGAPNPGQLALPGATGGTAAAGGLTSAGSWLSKLLTMGSSSSVVGADGTLLAVQGGVGGTLGSVAGALGSGATTAAGAAAVGAGSIAGAVGGILGLGSAIIDLAQGFGKSQQGDTKGTKDEFVTAGTKTGMVGAGAATGAAIGAAFGGVGAVPGALIGAGIGGVGALLGGDKAGRALSDATDEGGALSDLWQSVNAGAIGVWESVAEGAAAAGSVIAEKWQILASWFDDNVWTPISDTGVTAINIAAGVWTSIAEPIQEKWGELTGWFSENVWEPVKEKAQEAGQWISDRWAEAKDWTSETWSTFSGWFGETVWSPIKEGARAAGEWVGTKWAEVKTFVSDSWQVFSGWFDESVWDPVKEGARAAGEWIGNKISDAKDTITTAWEGISGWFSENVWDPIKGAASDAWSFVKEKWQGAKDWVAGIAEKGSEATGLTTSTGKSSVLAHASGGIMTQPHMGLVAEDGPEAIIPLGASSRSRGIAVWEQAGDILGANNPAPAGSNDSGLGWISAPPRIGSNDDGRGNIIPKDNWGGSQDGGNGDDIPVYSVSTPGPTEAAQSATVSAPVSVVLNQENNIQAADKMSAEEVAQILNDRIRGMVDNIGDEMAEQLARIFANMPVKGGA